MVPGASGPSRSNVSLSVDDLQSRLPLTMVWTSVVALCGNPGIFFRRTSALWLV